MKATKRMITWLLVLAMVFTMLPMPVHGLERETVSEPIQQRVSRMVAETIPEAEPEALPLPSRGSATIPYRVNPLYEGLYEPDPEDIPQFPEPGEYTPQAVTYQTIKNAAKTVRKNMVNRTETYTVYVKSESSNYNAVFSELLVTAMEHTGIGTEGDYLMWHLSGYGADLDYTYSNGYYNYTFYMITTFYTTAEQEQELTTAVKNLISSLGVKNKSDYEKVCAVYDYMCSNITYDYEHLEDESYDLMFTAYAALVNKTAVCQGYALLFYRLMLELGVDARFIGGDGGGPHAWNIVQLGDYYYNVDATWDAGYPYYYFFLKSTWNFGGHFRDPEYDYWEFHEEYPMAAEDYVHGEPATLDPYINMGYCGIEDMDYANAIWVMMRDGTLYIEGEGATYDYSTSEIPYWYYWIDHIEKAEISEGITRVGSYSFCEATALKEVSLPESLTQIGYAAFMDCTNLADISIPTNLTTLGSDAFSNCTKLTYVEIPGTVESIGWSAFENCTGLKEVIIHEGVETINQSAFEECTALENLVLPDSLLYIYMDAFKSCDSLTEVTIPENVKSLSGFEYCENLVTVNIKSNGTIASYAFYRCEKLENVVITGKIISIAPSAFQYCTGLKELTIPDTVVNVQGFSQCTGLETLELHNTGEIGSYAFDGCISLKTLTITNATSIGHMAFYNSDIETITIPGTVKELSHACLGSCDALTEIIFQGDAPEFNYATFESTTATAYYPGNNPTWTEEVMQNYHGTITWVPYTPECTDHTYEAVVTEPTCTEQGYTTYTCTNCGESYVDDYTDPVDHSYEDGFCIWCGRRDCIASGNCGKNGDQVTWTLLKDGTMIIAGSGRMTDFNSYGNDENGNLVLVIYWDNYFDQIKTLIVEEGVTYIGDHAFLGASELTTVVFADSVTEIGDQVFSGCGKLESVTFGKGLTETGIEVFRNCEALTEITLPQGDVDYGNSVFSGCINLSSVTIPDTQTTLGNTMFRNCKALTQIEIPESITDIGSGAFEGSGLMSVEIPNTVTSLGKGAFQDCDSLMEVEIPGSISKISYEMFKNCDNLTKVTFNEGTTEMSHSILANCPNVAEIIIPSTVTKMVRTFEYAYGLKEVTFTGNAPAISGDLFYGVTLTAYYPQNDTSWTEEVMQQYGGTVTWVGYKAACPGHDYEAVVTAPTCTEQGYTTYTCTNCGDSYVDDYTDPVGHVYEDGSCIHCGEADPNANKCGDNAFWNFELETGTLTISGEGAMYDYSDIAIPWTEFRSEITTLVIEDGITMIGAEAFKVLANLTDVTLPDSLTIIDDYAFLACESLETIDLPDNLAGIGQHAFGGCSSLRSIVIPASVTYVDAAVFERCTSLTDVLFLSDPDILSFAIGSCVFRSCTALEEIRVEKGHMCLRSIDGVLYIESGDGQLSLNDYPAGKKDAEFRLADNTVRIEQLSIEKQLWLETIIIPDTVTFIGDFAFQFSQNLKNVKFEGSVPELGNTVFNQCNITISYPCDDETWDARHDWDAVSIIGDLGSVTWVPDHAYESETTEPTCTEKGYSTHTCSACGDSYVDDHVDALGHDYEDGQCVRCGVEVDAVRWDIGTASLNGTIDLVMYVFLSEELVNDPETFARFTFENRVVDVPIAQAEKTVQEDGTTRCRFSCPLFAKQLADAVDVQIMRGETPVGRAVKFSVMQYCQTMLQYSDNPKLHDMCKAMLNYGAAAQQIFDYNIDNLANAILSEEEKELPTPDLSAYKHSVSGSEAGIRPTIATLTLESEIRIRVYFKLDEGRSIDEYTFTVDGVEVQPGHNASGWYIETTGIPAKRMEEMHEFKVGGLTVRYCALSYANQTISSAKPLEANMAKALYAYYAAAEAIFG